MKYKRIYWKYSEADNLKYKNPSNNGLKKACSYKKMAPWGQQSEHRLTTTSHDDYEANWNRRPGAQTGGQDHVLSQADALTKNE